MNHGRTIWLAALAALLVLGNSACGDDDGGGGDEDSAGTSGGAGHTPSGDDKDAGEPGGASGTGSSSDKDSGTPSAGEGGGGGGGTTLVDAGSSDGGGLEQCGSETCGSPMCCADAFQSLCGLQVNARACLPPQPASTMSDDRCPSVSINNGAFMIPSCCTEDMKCGINAQAAGMGCISLEEVIRYTSGMAGGDGGMAPMGMGFGIMWPEPKACN